MVEGAMVDYDTATRIESRYLAQLIVSPVAKNMINTFFFNLNAIKSGTSRPKDVPRYKPQKVGILGAGMMGAGIAYAQASRGIETVLEDVSEENAQRGKAYSVKLTQQRVDKGRMSPHDQKALLDRIKPTAYPRDLKGCDLIIEAVFENMAIKKEIFAKLDKICKPGAILASNTSTLAPMSRWRARRRTASMVCGGVDALPWEPERELIMGSRGPGSARFRRRGAGPRVSAIRPATHHRRCRTSQRPQFYPSGLPPPGRPSTPPSDRHVWSPWLWVP